MNSHWSGFPSGFSRFFPPLNRSACTCCSCTFGLSVCVCVCACLLLFLSDLVETQAEMSAIGSHNRVCHQILSAAPWARSLNFSIDFRSQENPKTSSQNVRKQTLAKSTWPKLTLPKLLLLSVSQSEVGIKDAIEAQEISE